MIFDDWDSDGPANAWTRWGWGCAAGRKSLRCQYHPERRGSADRSAEQVQPLHWSGTDAILLATAALGVAAVLHARHFWPETRSLVRWAPAGQFVGLAAIGGSLLALAYRVLLLQ